MNGQTIATKGSCWYFVHRYNVSFYYSGENFMKRKLSGLLTLSACAVVTVMGLANMPANEGSQFCSCPQIVSFDNELPMSHPINRCASQQSSGVSWSSWIRGRSPSYQFHFIDLLELLSRHSEAPKEKAPRQSWNSITSPLINPAY